MPPSPSHGVCVASTSQYKLTTHIKSGGFGSVYAGYNMETNVPVAAKLESGDGKSLLNEYTILQKLHDTGR